MPKRKDWYCPGYGAPHLIPGAGRLFLSCCRCRWNPAYRDPPEKKVELLKHRAH